MLSPALILREMYPATVVIEDSINPDAGGLGWDTTLYFPLSPNLILNVSPEASFETRILAGNNIQLSSCSWENSG